MARHVEDLLEASKRASSEKILTRTHVDLRSVIDFAITAIAPDLARRGHHLAVSLPGESLRVNADSSRLEQVFSNLLNNAAKYTPDGGNITLTMERVGLFASLTIRDSGIGIAPEVLPRVFDMFTQANSTAPCAEGGSGIGLAVVKNLVELHGGTVRAASAGLGLGSEFTVLLPAVA